MVKGLEKVRRQFRNNKAEEVCRDKSRRTWPKTALLGMIDNKIRNEKKERKKGNNKTERGDTRRKPQEDSLHTQ